MDDFLRVLNVGVAEMLSPTTAGIAIAVIGLNIHFGFTGLLNFGQAGFMLLGAYGFAISLTYDLPLPLAVLIGLACAFVFALVLGAPTLRLRGDYLAIVTIAAAEIIRFVGRLSSLSDFTGGALGIRRDRYSDQFEALSPFQGGRLTLLPFNYTDFGGSGDLVRILGLLVIVAAIVASVLLFKRGHKRWLSLTAVVILLTIGFVLPQTLALTGSDGGWWARTVGWGLALICSVIVLLLARSPWGRLLRGVREDEDAIRSLGKNVFVLKMQSLIIGGLFGALGGMVYVLGSSVQPDSLARQTTFFCYTALLLGGAATIFGPVLGSVLFFMIRGIIVAGADTYIPNSVMNTPQTVQFGLIITGAALMLLVIFRPQGLLGNKRELRFDG